MMPTQTLSDGNSYPSRRNPAGDDEPKKKIWPFVVLLIVIVLAAIYIALGFFSGRVLGAGTTVAGIDIGGKSATEAENTLRNDLREPAEKTIVLQAGESTAKLDPSKAGITFDAEATVDRVTGFSLDPTVIWHRLFGKDDVAPVIEVDEKKFDSATAKVTESLAVEPTNAELSFEKTAPKVKDGADGQSVDAEQVRTAIDKHWLRHDDALPVKPSAVEPDITTAEAKETADGFATDAVSGDVTITAKPGKDADSSVKGGELSVSPKIIAKTLTFKAEDSKLVPVFDQDALQESVLAANKDIGKPAKDASFTIKDGKPEVVPAENGIGIKAKELSTAVTDVIEGKDDKPTVTLASVKPDFTTKEAEKADVSSTVSHFSTGYNSEPNRDNNLRVASKKVSGTVLQPGEQFSLNEALGQRTAANGYKPAGVISDGQMKEDFGGGVSQVSTTLFNAAFFAGFDLDEHQAHSRYISRYPEGRETTLDWSSIDLKFTNTTKSPVVLDMYLKGGEVHAKVFGVKKYDVSADASDRFNHTSPGTVTESGSSCTPQAPKGGWSIKITRTLKDVSTGRTTKDDFTTVYRPVNKVECKG
ncbi:VanW family protein [Brevibacterium spongiae]|uniref:VanW family protein n=1 Tax=Brevibacterium spongiae TaxID=2909672 RepID=A0ABY5SWQ4_9MICO|nr:VanW family protein [Brevibacterium spongiae]UVI37578.1 VanW family protein [Brevibacterium spongiae]